MNKYEIIAKNNYYEGVGYPYLTPLGGHGDYGNAFGIEGFHLQFDVSVTNQDGNEKQFTVAFQNKCRNDGMRNYCGFEIGTAIQYGYDADESFELVEFCGGDDMVIRELYKIALKEAEETLHELLIDKEEAKND